MYCKVIFLVYLRNYLQDQSSRKLMQFLCVLRFGNVDDSFFPHLVWVHRDRKYIAGWTDVRVSETSLKERSRLWLT
jgi:hypothetical protein